MTEIWFRRVRSRGRLDNRQFQWFTLGCVAAVSLCLAVSHEANADAIVVTQAMKASTIAEVSIEDSAVQVDLEIGMQDLEAFVDILPDDAFQKLTGKSSPLETRLRQFFTNGLVLKVDDSPLPGRIDHLQARRRVVRDSVTGQPLESQPEDAEPVIEIRLIYELQQKPSTLSITPPGISESGRTSANIGFITYHRTLPVTDFRYLGAEETIELDWEDPWYSRFRNSNLKRQFDEPMSAFLYVENFEVRKEIIARPRDLQQWIDLEIEGKQTLTIAEQPALKKKVAEFLLAKNPLQIDGKLVTPVLDRIHFVRRSLRKTGVIDPPEDLDLTSATLGVIYVVPIDQLPETVEMRWELFSDRISAVPTVATDEAGGLPYRVSRDDPIVEWQNFLTNPTVPAMTSIAPPPRPTTWNIPMYSVIAFVLAAAAGLYSTGPRRRERGRRGLAIGMMALGTGLVCLPFGRMTVANPLGTIQPLSQLEVEQLLGDLLHNTYRAFDRRDERLIYERLATSIDGDLLTDVYVQVRTSMELENQGGARVKVTDVELLSGKIVEQRNNGGFVSECTWRARGSVGHWGHIHQQANEYTALLTVQPVDGVWKIASLGLMGVDRSVSNGGD